MRGWKDLVRRAHGIVPGAREGDRTARTEIDIDAPPAQVYEVLADADSDADWVVSAKEIRASDPQWPAPGATFHHTQGAGPVTLKDTTSVLESEPDRRLLLEVRGRPVVTAHTEFLLEPSAAGGTHVTMRETSTGGILDAVHNPLLIAAVRVRNQETLRRLRKLVEA
jgi:uncharacterized protein YndB with AHSA1/START domain